MRSSQGIRLFRTWIAGHSCYRPQCHLPFLTKSAIHLPERKSLQHHCLWSTTASILLSNNGSRMHHQAARTLRNHQVLQKHLKILTQEYQRIGQLLVDGSLDGNHRKTLSETHSELSPIAVAFQEIQEAEKEIQDVELMYEKLNTPEDKPLLELALEEKEVIDQKVGALWQKIIHTLIPREKYDGNNALLEVTAGKTTGGDICQQFTKEVFDMYQNYASYKCWTFETVNYTPDGHGGLHHAAARILGDGVYRHLKNEGGTHRVQRVPQTGLSSRMQRIHTGTTGVIVLPLTDEVVTKINPKDLRIDTFRAKGAGGQHVNKTDSAVRIVHLPTGLTVECQQERSQKRNKSIAMRTLMDKLHQQAMEKELSQQQSDRRLQLEARGHSERIRTYCFHQDRVTDHRLSHEIRDIKEFLSGQRLLDDLINELLEAAEVKLLTELLEDKCKSLQAGS